MNALQRRGLILCVLFLAGPRHSVLVEGSDWAVDSHPYRIGLKLERPIAKPTVVALDPRRIIERVAKIAIDQVNAETFAFERAVLLNPKTGKTVGRFRLLRTDTAIEIDGSFARLQGGEPSWHGFAPDKMAFKPVRLGGKSSTALMIREEKIANVKLQQTVQLVSGQRYLLEYWIMMNTVDGEMRVMLHHPHHRLFSQLRHSYFNKMPPPGSWEHQRVIVRPELSRTSSVGLLSPLNVDLRIAHAFVGQGGIAKIRLQPVAWRLIIEPDEPTNELTLYMMARAGHRLTVPTNGMLVDKSKGDVVTAELGEAQMQTLNPGAVCITDGAIAAWTIDPPLPMKVGMIRGYRPKRDQASAEARVDVFRGGTASLVIAVDAGTPRLDDLEIHSDLPAEVHYHRLATIPVYDGPTVNGQLKGCLIEKRYEAMVPVDYALDPDSEDGLHLIVATITPCSDTSEGEQHGNISLRFGNRSLTIPVGLRIAPVSIEPKRHFGSLFGASLFLLARPKGVANMAEDSVSIATFHGLKGDDLSPQVTAKLPSPNSLRGGSCNVRSLAERYFHTLLDHHLSPRCPGLYLDFSYDIVEQGQGLAPKLADWDFSKGFDQALEEFVIGRNMPWLTVYHSNGHQMHKLKLRNGVTYSVEANLEDPNWVKLSREQFGQLVGDYFDGIARHLEERGVLDRALFVIDESGPETYENIHTYVMAMKSRPYASQIKIGHTIQKTAAWTRRLPGGALLMDEVLDVPMPVNDEHYNYFEPEWNSRFEKPGKIQWVYNVESDHLNLENAGLSTTFLPLRLQHLGVDGWYDWECFIWSLPYAYLEGKRGGFKYGTGPVMNPWINPFYHHGPGVLSFFYPPDPRGPAEEPTDLIIPSYRLTLMRDGIQYRALIETLRANLDEEKLKTIESWLSSLWADNPVQWYLSYGPYRKARRQMHDLAMESLADGNP